MQYKIVQRTRELWSAVFDIVNDRNQIVGNITFNGTIGSMNGVFEIRYMNDYISMTPTSNEMAAEMSKGYMSFSDGDRIFKPYAIQYNGNLGIIFQHQSKTPSHKVLNLGNDSLSMYVIGFGKKGKCCPIYRGDDCIAEIHKEVEVYNDLHEFALCFPDYNIIPSQIIFACHSYVTGYYKPGEKMTKGVSKSIYMTKDKELISKCKNPYYLN